MLAHRSRCSVPRSLLGVILTVRADLTSVRQPEPADRAHRSKQLRRRQRRAVWRLVRLGQPVASMSYFGATESCRFNARMQLTNVTVAGQLNMTYDSPTGTNNGKIRSRKRKKWQQRLS